MTTTNGHSGMLEYLDRVLRKPATESNAKIVTETSRPGKDLASHRVADSTVAVVPERTAVSALAVGRFPAPSKYTAVLAKTHAVVPSLGVSRKKDFTHGLKLKVASVIARLPIDIVSPPVLVPTRPSPIALRGDAFYVIPDETNSVLHLVRGAPRVLEFSAQINIDADGKTVGGSATLVIALLAEAESADAELRREAREVAHAAGYPVRQWSFRALSLARVTPFLELPPGHEAAAQISTGNANAGIATFIVSLTPLAAQVWRQAYLDGTMALPGVCRVTSTFAVQDQQSRPATKELLHLSSLGALAQRAGVDALRTINAEQSVTTTILVDADPVIANVMLEMQATSGSVKTETFGPAGGQLSVPVTSPNLAQEQVRWNATVSYAPSSWPPIRTGGILSAANGWSTLIVPSSWRREVRFTAVLLDNDGSMVREEAPGDRVTGSIDFTADFLLGETGLQNSFQTQSEVIVTTTLPQPPGASPGKLKLTVFALRNGRDEMLVREITPEENWVLARIYPNGRIDIVTNRSPGSESGRQPEIVRMLEAVASPITQPSWPTIGAEVLGDQTGLRFNIESGPNPFWTVECATRPELFLPQHVATRNAHNYYTSLAAELLQLQRGGSLQLPADVWEKLRPARVLYYRLWTSSDRDAWRNASTTTVDELATQACVVTW